MSDVGIRYVKGHTISTEEIHFLNNHYIFVNICNIIVSKRMLQQI